MIEVALTTTTQLSSVEIQVAPHDRRLGTPEKSRRKLRKSLESDRFRCTVFAVGPFDASVGTSKDSVQRGN
jgi:hypothetical protein